MNVEAKIAKLGLELPNLEDLYRTNSSGAHYISHYAVQNLLYLSGTTPRKGGQGYLPGVVGKDLTLEQGYEAARYAVLMTLAAVKYALGDLDRVQQCVQLIGFVNSAPGFGQQPRVILRAHWPVDTLAGIALGLLFASLATMLNDSYRTN